MGWIVGTLILWGLKLIVTPFAKLLAGDKVKVVTPAAPPPSSDTALQDETGAPPAPPAPVEPEVVIPTSYYILADVLVLGLAGLLLGLFTGSYFIGFSWRAKDWPGMIAFVVASLIGSAMV
jgi:hypothetical protein